MNNGKEYVKIKVVLLGDTGVGKSSIAQRLVTKKFPNEMQSTIGASFFVHTTHKNGKLLKYEIWDTAGQERYKSIIPIYIRNAHVILITHDLSHPQTINSVENYWLPSIRSYIDMHEDTLVYVIGNKLDKLEKDPYTMIDTNLDINLYNVSAKTGHNIEELFTELSEKMSEKEIDDPLNNYYSLDTIDSKTSGLCCGE